MATTEPEDYKTLAQSAYEAYAKHQSWKNYEGNPIPLWEDVREDIRQAWGAAVDEILTLMGHT